MGQFDQFANQGGAAAWNPDEEAAEARRVAEEQLRTADYAGDLPDPLPRPSGRHAADGPTTAGEQAEGSAQADGAAEPTEPDVPRDLDVPDDLGD
jgi:hypothetical protein